MKREVQKTVTIKICDYCNDEIDKSEGYDWVEPYDFHKKCTLASAVAFVRSRLSAKQQAMDYKTIYMGMPVFESKYMTKKVQDWSGCRSKARAKRRHAKGIKTRMVEKEVPTAMMVGRRLYAHPQVIIGLTAV